MSETGSPGIEDVESLAAGADEDGSVAANTDRVAVGEAAATGQDVIGAASPEAIQVALQLGTLFRRMLSFGAASTSLLEAGAQGLSFLEFKAMMELGVFETRASFCLADISESTGASMPAVSRAIDSLVRKGLVSREEDPEDRRRRVITLTDEGHRVTNAALMGRAIGAVKLAESFSPNELRELDSVLSGLVEREDLASIYEQLEGAVQR